jgi:hypothetical protein
VTVRASDVALVYFGEQAFTVILRAQIGNRFHLLDPIPMVEFPIGFPAIDARMRG